MSCCIFVLFLCFFFNDTATTEIYTLSLHDALPISFLALWLVAPGLLYAQGASSAPKDTAAKKPDPPPPPVNHLETDRKSTRLNSSHSQISYAVFCLKKKKKNTNYQKNSLLNLKKNE